MSAENASQLRISSSARELQNANFLKANIQAINPQKGREWLGQMFSPKSA